MRAFLRLSVSTCAVCAVFAQSSDTSTPRFAAADIHPSPPSAVLVSRGPFIAGGRFDLHNTSVVDLIVRAYGITADRVFDGPTWLEYDHFDIAARVPAKTSPAGVKLMLQALLTERFQVVVRREDRPVPAYVLTAPKGKQKLKEADGSGESGCRMTLDQTRPADVSAGASPNITLIQTCKGMTMAALAEALTGMALAQQFIGSNPVQDKTGLDGKWDFTFKYTLPRGGPAGTDITLPDAVDKQIGLKLEQETVALPVVVVEKASRPSPNAPDIAQKIPQYPKEFEVATLKPTAPQPNGGALIGIRLPAGGRVELTGLPLKTLLQQAWSLPSDSIVGAPKWMETDRYDLVGKMPAEFAAGTNTSTDLDAVWTMVRALLVDRFKLASHMEDRPVTAFTLTAPKAKLKKADPASRTKWTDATTPIVPSAGSAPSRTVKFQNMSMAQLADKLSLIGSAFIHAPVVDGTGLDGGYDFTLTFSPLAPAQLAQLARAQENAGGAAAADPLGGVTIFEAIDKQLGLKLVEQKRPTPVLVIDHIEEKPTDN